MNKLQIRDNQEGTTHQGFECQINGVPVEVVDLSLELGFGKLTRATITIDCELLTAPGFQPIPLKRKG